MAPEERRHTGRDHLGEECRARLPDDQRGEHGRDEPDRIEQIAQGWVRPRRGPASGPSQTIPQTQNTTPNATPITAATTMSRVRQRVSGRAAGAVASMVLGHDVRTSSVESHRNAVTGLRDGVV